MALLDKAAEGLAAFVGLRGLAALILFPRFPITRESHARIRAKLDARAAGSA